VHWRVWLRSPPDSTIFDHAQAVGSPLRQHHVAAEQRRQAAGAERLARKGRQDFEDVIWAPKFDPRRTMISRRGSGRPISARRTGPPTACARARCGSTAAACSTPRCRSAATRSRAGAGRWATTRSITTSKPSPWSPSSHGESPCDGGAPLAPPSPSLSREEGTMRAAVVHEFTHPLSIDNVPRPEPSDGRRPRSHRAHRQVLPLRGSPARALGPHDAPVGAPQP
jgi:hypothetical protein